MDEQRDLALDDLWAASLERSLARRGRRPRTSLALAQLRPARDLAELEHAHDSLAFSRRRRAAVAASSDLPAPAARSISLAALLTLTAGPAVGFLAVGTGTAAAAPAAIEQGDSGRKVKQLQRALGVPSDGEFGPRTKRALRKFQARNGLAVDGVAGPATWAALGRAEASTARAGSGAVKNAKDRVIGGSVRKLQRQLGVPADGVFGPRTLAALRKFQARNGLTVDGVAGPATWSALQRDGGARTARTASGSGTRAQVEALQRALGVGADGVFGPATEAAVRDFQSRNGLDADGVAGPATRSALGLGDGPVLRRVSRRASRAGGDDGLIARMVAAGDRIATYPYKYGGGHGSFTDNGYDCSGSVSYVLHAAGLLDSPLDSGSLMSYGDAGAGRRVTIYSNPGHVYMVIDGRRYDTSARSQTGSRWSSEMRSSAGYVARHPPGL